MSNITSPKLKSQVSSLSTRYKDLTKGLVNGKPITTKYDMKNEFNKLVTDTKTVSVKLKDEITTNYPKFYLKKGFNNTFKSRKITLQDPIVSMER